MAVRAFDVTDTQSPRLAVVQSAPRRRDLRRARQRYAVLGIVCVTVPFAGALVALGVSH